MGTSARFSPPAIALHREGDFEVEQLRARMDDFYARPMEYTAFDSVSDQRIFWDAVVKDIERRALTSGAGKCRVLEFGAGRTGFSDFVGTLRRDIHFVAQDVTRINEEFLRSKCDEVYFGDVKEISGQFDVILSTFVWEHVSAPMSSLRHLLGLLALGGTLYLASPRYDFPFYLPPSARHYNAAGRLKLRLMLLLRRMAVMLGGPPDVLIHTDPAALSVPWYRDADAIHWVSRHDLPGIVGPNWVVERVPVSLSGLKGRFWARFLLLSVRIRRSAIGLPPDS
jgi:SAM-dependent methyltransferase